MKITKARLKQLIKEELAATSGVAKIMNGLNDLITQHTADLSPESLKDLAAGLHSRARLMEDWSEGVED